jgi:hypothetical protein
MSRLKKIHKLLQDEVFGPGFNFQYPPYTDDPEDDHIDVPDAVDTPYVTHRPFALPKGKKAGSNYYPLEQEDWLRILEQEDDEKKDKKKKSKDIDPEEEEFEPPEGEEELDPEDEAAMAATAGEESAEEATGESDEEVDEEDIEGGEVGEDPETAVHAAGSDPDAGLGDEAGASGDLGDTGGDVGMGDETAGMGGDMGMGQEEEEKSPTELGRIYELKKVYARMTAIEAYLGSESSEELLKVRNYVSQAIELFEIISANFNSYKGKLNEIIVIYYKFIKEVYDSIKDYYKKQAKTGDK